MMGTVHSSEQNNNLELYMNDVFEKECEFKIEQEEVEFIQTGIETLVQDLVDQILEHDSFDKLISNFLTRGKHNILMEKHKILVEVYFPIQSYCAVQRYVAENASCVKKVKSTIIKVGSFYDGTRNSFPDEFDFIFPLLGVKNTCLPSYSNDLIYHVCTAINVYGKFLCHTSLSEKLQVTRKLKFQTFMGIHGPAYKMQFIYSNGFREPRPIHVDLVPAFKINLDSNIQQLFLNIVRHNVEPKTFREETLSAGSCLYVRKQFTFTEIEQHFMKNILSKKHVKVYRILKYLLNGHGDGEACEDHFGHVAWCYTSYHIKTLMIYHHDACTNTDTEDLGPCVLHVLQELSTYNDPSQFPSLNGLQFGGSKKVSLLPDLKSTITYLQSMQTSKHSYNYEGDKIKSVSRQYLDRKTRRSCVISQ